MTPDLAVVVRCANQVRHLQSTVDSVLRSDAAASALVIVVDETTPAAALPWVQSLAGENGISVVRAIGSQPGAARNAGIRASAEALIVCLDAGDRLDRRYLGLARSRLEREEALGWVTSWVLSIAPEEATVRRVEEVGLSGLVSDPGAVHSASMFRRTLWSELDGFDETLPVLDDYDFWLRAVRRGRGGRVLDMPLLMQLERDGSSHWLSLTHPARPQVIELLAERHRDLFEAHLVASLYGFERQMRHLSARHRDRVSRRDRLVSELERLSSRREELRAQLPPERRDQVEMGDLRRTSPISTNWGYERGTPIDRRYIEAFLDEHAADIQGVVLEVQESDYTKRFGGDRVTSSEIIDLDPTNERATLITDLRNARNAPSNRYDCIILTQTVHVLDDMKAAIREAARMLRPGGVLLATFPCVSRICLEYGWDADLWRVTEAGVRNLFSEAFAPEHLEFRSYGNVLVNAAFQYGLGCHEIDAKDFEAYDPYNPTLVGVRAKKAPAPAVPGVRHSTQEAPRGPFVFSPLSAPGIVLLYHRVAAPASDVHALAVPVSTFRQQMEYLKRSWNVMPLGEFVEANASGCLPDRAVTITFDDGYIDNLTDAAPILVDLGLPATFFLTTQAMHGRTEYWWDTLERVMLGSREVPATLELSLNGDRVVFDMATPEPRMVAHARIHRALVDASLGARDDCMWQLARWAGALPPPPSAHIMTEAQTQELARLPGCDIGAHTVHHLGLPAQPPAIAEREMAESRLELERVLARPVTALAYPYGYCSDETVAAARRAGLAAAFTCEARAALPHDDTLRLPRMEVNAWNAEELDHRLEAILASIHRDGVPS